MSFWSFLGFGTKKKECCGCCKSCHKHDDFDFVEDLGLSDEETKLLQKIDAKVVVGKILEIAPHPDPKMTKVRVTQVDLGKKKEQVLCGGVNIHVGAIVPVATVGAKLPGDFEIGERKIRDIVSRGMICSRTELGLSRKDEPDHGIWLLPASYEKFLGTSFSELV